MNQIINISVYRHAMYVRSTFLCILFVIVNDQREEFSFITYITFILLYTKHKVSARNSCEC